MITPRIRVLPGLLVLLAIGCGDRDNPLLLGKADTPVKAPQPKRPVRPELAPRPTNAIQSDHAAVKEASAFLSELVAGNFKAAASRTSVSLRKQVCGQLSRDEEKERGYSDDDTAAYLRTEVAELQGPRLLYQVIRPDGHEVSIRGDRGDYDAYPFRLRAFCLRLADEGNCWRVTRFATAHMVALAMPPQFDDGELAWAREAVLDFLEVLGKHDEHLLSIDLMTEDFMAGLPAHSAPDPGVKYARKDVCEWLDNKRFFAERHEIAGQSMVGTRATFAVKLIGRFYVFEGDLTLTREVERWKVASFPNNWK